MVSRIFQALLAYVLQSLIVLAASGAAELPLVHALRWLARHAHVGAVHHALVSGVDKPVWLASGVWLLAQLCLTVHTLRALRHGRDELSWSALVLPLLVVLYVGGGLLVLAGMDTFVSNTSRVFLSESASLWAGFVAAALLGVWLLQLGWTDLPRRSGWGRR